MPLLVHCEELQPGMRLAEAFMYHNRMMLPGGKVLANDEIDLLRRKYPDVMFKIGDPVLDSVIEFEDDGRERDVASSASAQITQSLSKVQERFSDRTALASVNFNAMRNAAASVIEYLKTNPVSAALLTRSGNPNNYLSEHAGNAFYLAIVLGSAVRDYVVRERVRQTAASHLSASVAMDLLPLGLGAMFMDVGMYALERLFTSTAPLTDEDRKAIRNHPIAGADLLPDNLPPGTKMIVRAHHENVDGTGYPAATPGSQLHIFTRIARIADAYEAATAQRIYAAAKSPARALWEMSMGPYARCYDPILLKMFRTLIQPFPIGARIRLSDGRYAVVVRYNRKEPFRPTVIVAFDASGNRLEKEQLSPLTNVGEGNDLRLASYDGEDLGYLYSTPMPAIEARGQEFETLLDAAYP